MLFIVASSKRHFDHICYQFQIEKDQVRYISRPEQLHGNIGNPKIVLIFAEDWFRDKSERDCEAFEFLAKDHNSRRKLK